ncbi:hypothetical protein SESBI_04243 [Sesbania bispinosa]|nr:hypothetical protein SESBI_04243 [Sesbania bispinosa]
MKRQRGVNVNGANPMNPSKVEEVAAMGKKKTKKLEAEQKVMGKSVVVVEEESREREVGGLLQGRDSHNVVMGWNWDEYMSPWLGGVVDEQMSWGSTWFPGWDMDFMGDAFTALYNDVVWDDDIWNLNNQIPIPLDRKR